jgi:hypothetical protein
MKEWNRDQDFWTREIQWLILSTMGVLDQTLKLFSKTEYSWSKCEWIWYMDWLEIDSW